MADIPPEYLEEMKKSYYSTKVYVSVGEAQKIEQCTRQQAESEQWKNERRKRLTASRVGGIVKMRKTTKRTKRVQELLYSTFQGNRATAYGTEMEEVSRQEYTLYQRQKGHPNLTVHTCGLCISVNTPWLAASPDGMVDDPSNPPQPFGLLEIKNPYSMRQLTLNEACISQAFCLKQQQSSGDISYKLKTTHDYYYQIQCQLYCADRAWCDFVLRTEKALHVERVFRDYTWWDKQMPKLHSFYFSAVLPELACPRHRMGGIREPSTN